jgi:2-polyprenyl-6-hydroxyphenyl methylase/3-demethylubiquinone-9 3-methyltransferase
LDICFNKYIPPFRGKTILELGCGGSIWMPYFARKFDMDVYGIDYSEEGIKRSQQILAANRTPANLILGDILGTNLEYQENFSIVFSLGLLEHFSDTERAIQAFLRFVAPGGLLITWTPNTCGWILSWSKKLNPAVNEIYAPLTITTLVEAHKRLGVQILDARYTQLLDLSLLNLLKWHFLLQGLSYRLFSLLALPFIFFRRGLDLSLQSERLGAGILIVAKKSG